ncbi:two component transcriptional regulator, winged helix family [Methylobacillus rhizosphaerae]|uniref:Two component transcriptional regulator, winged helix family n=1 Tax=Methylobacillus rhizosphaerae TaxID=551994 RepID=A0A239ADG1_9PROT|nr:response regulator [Methylobacillus rhizosphaerae]SNR93687.1 two component transcriptional regulator, winged helix family [Methylobacillus rhizosphaerae]
MKILLVEDDQMIGESLEQSLGRDGYAVNWCKNAKAAEVSLRSESYSLILLDLGLPDRSGIELLRDMRRTWKLSAPVLILTARDSIQDRVTGLNAGADDYLIKPFALAELEARIRALLRRATGQADTELSSGDLRLNTATKVLHYHGQEFTLSAREYAVMYALLETPGKVWSRTQLEERIYGWQEEVESNAVEFHIHQLRKKLGPETIVNIRGMGYRVKKAENS